MQVGVQVGGTQNKLEFLSGITFVMTGINMSWDTIIFLQCRWLHLCVASHVSLHFFN